MSPGLRPTLAPSRIETLRRRLLSWYEKNRRALPWRGASDPYRILLSEFMLQQTRVATVLPYFDSFLLRFPDLQTLAEAPEETVRAAWSGLGYYSRARNLQRTARAVLRDHDGRLPADLAMLRRLPGVGEYTAAALGSLVHGIPRAVVDGNVVRVITRLLAWEARVCGAEARRAVQETADRLLDPNQPGEWNQAMMELGATVCTARSPGCPRCPWLAECRAAAQGTPGRYPRKKQRPAPVTVERIVGVVRRGDRVLLTHRRHPRLLDGTWEFPGLRLEPEREPRAALAEHLRSVLGGEIRVGVELARVRHSITHHRITVRGFAVHAAPVPRARRGQRAWVTAGEMAGLATSSMTAKLLAAMERRFEQTRS